MKELVGGGREQGTLIYGKDPAKFAPSHIRDERYHEDNGIGVWITGCWCNLRGATDCLCEHRGV